MLKEINFNLFGSDCALSTLKVSCFEILIFLATSCARICNKSTFNFVAPYLYNNCLHNVTRMGTDLFSKSDSNPWR